MKKKDNSDLKIAFILFALLWFLLIIIVSSYAYLERTTGESITLFDAMNEVGSFGIFHWLNPTTWGKCLKWSFFYWIGIALFLIYEQKFKHDAAGIEAGSAKWNDTVEEFNETHTEPFGEKIFSDEPGLTAKRGEKNLNNPKTPPVPGNPNMIESATVRLSTADMKTHLNNNVFIVGGAGTGKSRFFIKPNVLQMNCSYVVTDPSGELLRSMHNVLVENGYTIKVFNLVDMTHSNKYNPFRYIKKPTDVSILVDCFISNTTAPDQKSGDPFWDKSEKALLSSLIFYLWDIADEEFQKFSTVLWMVQLAQMDENVGITRNTGSSKANQHFSFSLDSPLDELFNGTKKITKKEVIDKYGKKQIVLDLVDITDPKEITRTQDKIETSLCLTNYKTFKLGGTKTLKSILISAAVRLNPFSIPEIQNLTDEDNVELGEVGDRLTCFFAIIPQTNSTFNFLISMLFSQMFEALYYKGSTIDNSRLNYHVRFLLDEFANIGKIPEFPQKISTCRKYNISATIVLQSIAQIKMLYKDDYETIIGNCDTAICLGTNEQTTADYFSKKLGKATITSRNKSTQVGKAGGSLSFQQTGRELLMPDEIMTMPFDECIVMMNHIDPFYDKKYPLETHPQYEKTGDASADNLYHLEKDDEFLCIDKSQEYSEEICFEEMKGPVQDEFQPKPLAEVLGDLLQNIPEEDGYYLIKDVDKEERKSLYSKEREKLMKTVEKCIEHEWKTVFYDGEMLDVHLIQPLIIKMMNSYSEQMNDIMIACNGISSNVHICYAAIKDEECNIIKAFKKLSIPYKILGKDKSGQFMVVQTKSTVNDADLNELKKGCEKGYQAVVVKQVDIDDDFPDYSI